MQRFIIIALLEVYLMSFNFRNVLSLSLNITREKVWTTLAFYIFHINQEQWFSLQVSLELKRQHKTISTWFRNVNQSPHRTFFSSILPFFLLFFNVRLLSVLRGHSMFSSPPQRPMIIFSGRLLSVLRAHTFFSIPARTSNDLRLRRISIPDLTHYIIFLS